MDKTICGHDRDVLIWALASTARWPAFVAGLLEPSPGLPVYTQRVLREWLAPGRETALRAIHYPTKLAEMLAERGRELGLDIAIYDNHRRFRMSGAPVVYALLIAVDGVSIQDRDKRGWDLDMPQARAILLQWLQLPDGAREEAEKVLRGET